MKTIFEILFWICLFLSIFTWEDGNSERIRLAIEFFGISMASMVIYIILLNTRL